MSDLALALDGATYASSAAILRDGSLVAEGQVRESDSEKQSGRGEALVPLIEEMMRENGLRASELKTVICGAGPGSFTSLRVAASVAKGMAFASGAKMYAVPSLMLTVAGRRDTLEDASYISVIPAMRGEFFALPVSVRDGIPESTAPTHSIVSESGLGELVRETKSQLIGPGQEIDASPHARGCAALYETIIRSGEIDLDSWEPDYGRLAEAQVKWEAAHGRPLRA